MSDPQSRPPSGISGVPMVVAVGAVLVWIAFVVILLGRTDAEAEQWTRLTFVFASVQALAFAGAGALFGVSVQGERVRKAEQAAEDNAEDAANGRALATFTIVDDVESDLESLPRGDDSSAVRRRHAEAARRLFPDLT